VLAKRNAELEPIVDAAFVHLANVVIHSSRPEHWSGDTGIDRERLWQHAHTLRARHQNLIAADEPLEFIHELREIGYDLSGLVQPTPRQVHAATAKPHV